MAHYGYPYGQSSYAYMISEYDSMKQNGYSQYYEFLEFKEKQKENEKRKKFLEKMKEKTDSIKKSLNNLINK